MCFLGLNVRSMETFSVVNCQNALKKSPTYTSLEAKTLADRQHRQVQEGRSVHEAPSSAAAGSTEPAARASPSRTPNGASPPGCGCPATPSQRGARRRSRN